MRAAPLAILSLVAGCGGAGHSIAGVTVGARVSADDPRVVPGDDEHTLLLRDPGT